MGTWNVELGDGVVLEKTFENVTSAYLGDVVGGNIDVCEAVADLEHLPKSRSALVPNVPPFKKIKR